MGKSKALTERPLEVCIMGVKLTAAGRPHRSQGGHTTTGLVFLPAEVFSRAAAQACWGEALLLCSDRISHLFTCFFVSFFCFLSTSSTLSSPVLSGTGPPPSEWNEDGLRSQPFPPAWPLHTATLCWQQNHLLQGIECVLRYYLFTMIKYEMKFPSTFRPDEAHLRCSEISIKIFSCDGNFITLVFDNGSKTILFFFMPDV